MSGLSEMSGVDLGRCCYTPASLSGMGADAGVIQILEEVYDGTYARRLKATAKRIRDGMTALSIQAEAARQVAEPFRSQALSKISEARNLFSDANMDSQKAINEYQFIRGEIGRVASTPPSALSGLGALPVAVIAIAGGTAVVAACYALSRYFDGAYGKSNSASNIAYEIPKIIEAAARAGVAPKDVVDIVRGTTGALAIPDSGGGLTSSIGKVALLAGLGFVAWKVLAKKGVV